ncbi:hypothetical protein GCM10023149_08310 [Mucilaginibacter gynuensis]|uniref:histidine kinase n=2 Tax=Mucilaginibacter gynuensis TaxID=1302236 RepID=A0ABP8FX66_9SPHI
MRPASAQEIVTIGEKSLVQLNEISLRDSTWYFLPQSKALNQPYLGNTEGWTTFNYTTFGNVNAPKNWRGEGWFSVWLQTDKTLAGKKLSLRINHDGASEIFIDGHAVGGYGQVGHTAISTENARAPRQIIPVWFNDTKPHLLTIHYANHKVYYADFAGFEIWIGDYKKVSARINRNILLYNTIPLCAAAQIILALLHFLLYLFYRKRTIYLYYAAFVMFVGISALSAYFFYQAATPQLQWAAQVTGNLCTVMQLWTSVTLLYALGLVKLPKRRFIALSVICTGYLAAYVIKALYYPEAMWNDYFYLIYLFWMVDAFRSVIPIIRRRDKGAWLIVTGVIVVVLTYFFAWADVFGLWPYYSSAMRLFMMNIGELVLPVCLSLYLALDFTRTNQVLSEKLSEVEMLSTMALTQEAEKNALIAGEARRLEILVADRTAELELQAEKLKEADLIKSRFFTNITHELKTPLTLILNPAEELMASPALQTQAHAHLIYNNATRLLELLNQLLDLSKIENGAMKVTYAPLDLVAVINTHLSAYEITAAKKNISLSFTSLFDKLWIMGDNDKVGKVVANLLSNAVKFTDNGGVDIALQKFIDNDAGNILIKVSDTGKGIPKEKLAHIFTRFYQADLSDTRSAEGSGIGLALTKELTELMGGRINVVSTVDEGTEMIVVLQYFPAPPIQNIIEAGKTEIRNSYNIRANATQSANPDKPLVLLVEDHEELRNYLYSLLSVYYQVITAEDGEQGIAIGMEQIPTAIITDIMLPKVNGYELAARFKADIKTSHIPIIMLTAKADTDSKVQGIETGADAYLAKPFNNRELLATVENLIDTRNRLREYYTKEQSWLSDQTAMPNPERDFISLIRQTVLKHLDDETYTVERLANDIGMSIIQLHRKLKAVAGQGPGELIRLIRLETAYQLLEKQNLTVAEVAYKVGFSNPTSFSVSFSRHFGFPPKSVGVV